MSEQINIFLENLRFNKYKKQFIEDFAIKSIKDFESFISQDEDLKLIGLTNLEINRFKRKCRTEIQEIIANTINHKDVGIITNDTSCTNLVASYNTTSACVSSNFTIASLTNQKCMAIPSLKKEQKFISLSFRVLAAEHILCYTPLSINIDESILYYQLVDQIYNNISKKVTEFSFNSVELFAETGYPLATTPPHYFKPIKSWNFQEREFIYVMCKSHSKILKRSIIKRERLDISVVHDVSNQAFIVTFDVEKQTHVFAGDILQELAIIIHLPIFCINLIKVHLAENSRRELVNEKEGLTGADFKRGEFRLEFSITDDFWEPTFLNAFSSKFYNTCITQDSNVLNELNAYLLFICLEEKGNASKEKIKSCLSLLREMSRNPPLVYSFYLFLTNKIILFPHKVAIMEGLVSLLTILLANTPDNAVKSSSKLLNCFRQLWIYIERNASPEKAANEIYESNYISKRTRENPRDDETRRVICCFPPHEDNPITWKNVPNSHGKFSFHLACPFNRNISNEDANLRFPLLHPMKIYTYFMEQSITTSLMQPLITKLSSPCVFIGRTKGRYGKFDYYSPEASRCLSYDPHEIITSDRLKLNEYNRKYRKVIVILDVSNDMNITGFYESSGTKQLNELGLNQLGAAYLILLSLIDTLISMRDPVMLGLVLISNDHGLVNGYHELYPPTLEYAYILDALDREIKSLPSWMKDYNSLRLPDGIIINALEYLIKKSYKNAEYYLITNEVIDKKLYGAKQPSITNKLKQSKCILNTIILGNHNCHTLKEIVDLTKGQHINLQYINRLISRDKNINATYRTNLLLEYISVIQVCLTTKEAITIANSEDTLKKSSLYRSHKRFFKGKLENLESVLAKFEQDEKSHLTHLHPSRKSIINILQQLSRYQKSPHPYVSLYVHNNDILTCLLSIQDHTTCSFLLLYLTFPDCYPQVPPLIKFITPIYHPNVDNSGNICHPIIGEEYHSGLTLRTIIDSIYSMLSQPVISHMKRSKVTEIYLFYRDVYEELYNSCLRAYDVTFTNRSDFEKHFGIKPSLNALNYPKGLVCPLTGMLFESPVFTPDGTTYDRHAIISYIKTHGADPETKRRLKIEDLHPNKAISDAVFKFKRSLFTTKHWWDQ